MTDDNTSPHNPATSGAYYHPGENPAIVFDNAAPDQGDGAFDAGDIRPSYYKAHDVHEVKNCLKAWGVKGKAYIWTAVVYLARLDLKGSEQDAIDDLCKARFWIDEEIRDRREAMSAKGNE